MKPKWLKRKKQAMAASTECFIINAQASKEKLNIPAGQSKVSSFATCHHLQQEEGVLLHHFIMFYKV